MANDYLQISKRNEVVAENAFIFHHQINKQKQIRNQQAELLCACNGLTCAGICREQHLHRPRFAGVKANKKGDTRGTPDRQSWADKCPSAYEKPQHYRS